MLLLHMAIISVSQLCLLLMASIMSYMSDRINVVYKLHPQFCHVSLKRAVKSLPAITCAPLSSVAGGSVSYDQTANGDGNYPFGTMATLVCDSMFSEVGVSSSVCGDGTGTVGEFTPPLGSCQCE